MLQSTFKSVIIPLFLVINVIGNIPLFLSLLSPYEIKHQRMIILREFIIALAVLILFTFFGDDILLALGISRPIIAIAGGVLLFIVALMMIFPKHDNEKAPRHEPIIIPLAIPTIAGPGAITSVMVFSQRVQNDWIMCLCILAAWIPSVIIIFCARYIKYALGERGMVACERFGGMLVILIAINMLSTGVIDLVKINF